MKIYVDLEEAKSFFFIMENAINLGKFVLSSRMVINVSIVIYT